MGLHSESIAERRATAVFPLVEGRHVDTYDAAGIARDGNRTAQPILAIHNQIVLLHFVAARAGNP